jgi:hypothetical protein
MPSERSLLNVPPPRVRGLRGSAVQRRAVKPPPPKGPKGGDFCPASRKEFPTAPAALSGSPPKGTTSRASQTVWAGFRTMRSNAQAGREGSEDHASRTLDTPRGVRSDRLADLPRVSPWNARLALAFTPGANPGNRQTKFTCQRAAGRIRFGRNKRSLPGGQQEKSTFGGWPSNTECRGTSGLLVVSKSRRGRPVISGQLQATAGAGSRSWRR